MKSWNFVLKYNSLAEILHIFISLDYLLQNKMQIREVCDNNIPIVKSTVCAAIVSPDKIVCGTDEGLFSYELSREALLRIDDIKKVLQVEMIPDEQLLIVLAGECTN